MAFLLKKAIFSPNVELEGIARQVVEVLVSVTEAEIGGVIIFKFFRD